MNVLENRRQAINKLHNYLMHHVPIVRQYIALNGYKLKKDGSLYEKDYKAIKALLPDFETGRVWIRTSQYSNPVIEADIYYATSEHCVEYYKRSYYMDATNEFNLPTYTSEEFLSMATRMERHKEEWTKNEDAYRSLARIINNK